MCAVRSERRISWIDNLPFNGSDEQYFSSCQSHIIHKNRWSKPLEAGSKAVIVRLILNGRTEIALGLLAKNYGVSIPKLKVGLPKSRKGNAFGCYTAKDETISVLNSDVMKNPFVVLHEFYHHLRTSVDKKHRGTEKNANRFADEFIEEYKSAATRAQNNF